MAEISREDFVANLEKSQLLRDAQLQLLRKQLVGNPLTTESLASVLVSQGHLTEWQSKQLLRGQVGFVLDHYQLLDPIGRGGMGHVFRGMNTRTNTVVAVKVMAKNLVGNRTLVSRFRREIRANSQLDSAHIVRSLDAGRVGKVDFMVMEFVNGDQLDRIASRLGRIPFGLACEIVRQVAGGLQHAHENQMVHRDIKPANVMVHWEDAGEGIVKLMDMGLVRLMSDDEDESMVTRAGQVMGTPDYMSPEQGWDTATVDIRSDIYSLGCTLFRLLTGTIPFTGSNPLQVLSQRLQRDAPSVRTLCEDIPEEVAAIVAKMTMRDPEARYQEPRDLVDALAPFCEPLTRQNLKLAAAQAIDDPNANFVSTEDSEPSQADNEEADGTYRQFLNEVQAGSAVNLMLATEADASSASETLPHLNIDLPQPTSRSRSDLRTNRRGLNFGLKALALIAAVVAAAGAAVFMNSDRSGDVTPRRADTASRISKPATAKFVTSPPSTAVTGDKWNYVFEVDVSGPPGLLNYELTPPAPAGMHVATDPPRLVWAVPASQQAGTVAVQVRLTRDAADESIVLDELSLEVAVMPGLLALKMPEHRRPFQLAPGETFRVSMAPESPNLAAMQLRYAVQSDAPGLAIDGKTGELTWKPVAPRDLGRYAATVSVAEVGRPERALTGQIRLAVVPSHISHVLPPLPTQRVQAGELFRFPLPTPPMNRAAGQPVIALAPEAPAGVMIDPQSGNLTWNVPKDAAETIDIPLVARLETSDPTQSVNLQGRAMLRLSITAPLMPPQDESETLTFAEPEVLTTLTDLRKTFSAALAQARTTTDRTHLAWRLMEQVYAGSPGVADVAMMRLIEQDLASKARATDVLLELARLRASRYGHDELASAQQTLTAFRRTGLSQMQGDLIVEQCLRLASIAISKKQFELTERLLSTAKGILGRGNQGAAAVLAGDVARANKLAAELTKEPVAADAIKVSELTRLLDRWQFEDLFSNPAALKYAEFSTAAAAGTIDNAGRRLWNIDVGTISVETATAGGVIAVIDGSRVSDRFVLRFEMSPQSNCGQILFGVVGTSQADLNGGRMTLHGSAFGQLHGLRNSTAMNDPAKIAAPSILPEQGNLVELIVDTGTVILRVNGAVVTQADIPSFEKGQIAIAADLRQSGPVLAIRRPRLLILPASD